MWRRAVRRILSSSQRVGQVYSALLTASVLADDGQYLMQVRGTLGEQVRHSNIFYATVHDSINAVDAFPPPLPSEFEQMEERITELTKHPPRPGLDGFWEIWNPDSGQYEASVSRCLLAEGEELVMYLPRRSTSSKFWTGRNMMNFHKKIQEPYT